MLYSSLKSAAVSTVVMTMLEKQIFYSVELLLLNGYVIYPSILPVTILLVRYKSF